MKDDLTYDFSVSAVYKSGIDEVHDKRFEAPERSGFRAKPLGGEIDDATELFHVFNLLHSSEKRFAKFCENRNTA